MRAAEYGHLEVVKYLVQAGADKEKQDEVRSTFSLCCIRWTSECYEIFFLFIGGEHSRYAGIAGGSSRSGTVSESGWFADDVADRGERRYCCAKVTRNKF